MGERLNLENLGWGFVFSALGIALLTERIGWWELSEFDLAVIGPVLLVLVGLIVLISSFLSRRPSAGG